MKDLKREGMLFCLVGPSAGGKTTMGAHLLATYAKSLRLSISATTRAPRDKEEDGVDYYFMDREDFEAKVAAGAFFEWAEVHGNLYGTLKEPVEAAIKKGQDLLLDIDIQGVHSFKKFFPAHTVVSFIMPPSIQLLKERMLARGKVSKEELERRIETAKVECANLFELAETNMIEYFVLNDNKEYSQQYVCAIYEAERLRIQRLVKSQLNEFCNFSSVEGRG